MFNYRVAKDNDPQPAPPPQEVRPLNTAETVLVTLASRLQLISRAEGLFISEDELNSAIGLQIRAHTYPDGTAGLIVQGRVRGKSPN